MGAALPIELLRTYRAVLPRMLHTLLGTKYTTTHIFLLPDTQPSFAIQVSHLTALPQTSSTARQPLFARLGQIALPFLIGTDKFGVVREAATTRCFPSP